MGASSQNLGPAQLCNLICNRSGSSITGKLLSQGLRAPNYVYEPLAIFINDIKKLDNEFGLELAHLAKRFREEIMNVFLTGLPNKTSVHAPLSKSGVNVNNGGDVITKTIRLRYLHLKGWVENQESLKVNLNETFITCLILLSTNETFGMAFT